MRVDMRIVLRFVDVLVLVRRLRLETRWRDGVRSGLALVLLCPDNLNALHRRRSGG
jgi:hypothetical protein